MKAIVLTCDRYLPFADHMIRRYMELWRGNPFTFYIPYQVYPDRLKEKYGDKIRLIQTPADIKSTMQTLLQHTGRDEWVYWCMDDRYPDRMQSEQVSRVYDWVLTMPEDQVSGVLFTYPMSKFNRYYVRKRSVIQGADEQQYVELINYSHFWYHQFLKAGVLMHFADHLPDEMAQAKQMDQIKNGLKLPAGTRRYVRVSRLASFGESTNRGKITLNCAESMKNYCMELPPNFPILNRKIVKGSRDYEHSPLYYKLRSIYHSLLGIKKKKEA